MYATNAIELLRNLIVIQTNDEVRIDIDDNVQDIHEEVNPSREHIVDIPEPVVRKAKAPMQGLLLHTLKGFPSKMTRINSKSSLT